VSASSWTPTRSHPPPRRQRHRFEIPKGEPRHRSSRPPVPTLPVRSDHSVAVVCAPYKPPASPATPPARLRNLKKGNRAHPASGPPRLYRQRGSTRPGPHRRLPFGHLRHVLRPLRTAARFRHWPRFEKANRAHPASGPPRLPSSGPAGSSGSIRHAFQATGPSRLRFCSPAFRMKSFTTSPA